MNTSDTITAPASGTGGAVTVIRVSGPRAVAIAGEVWKGRKELAAAVPRMMYLGKVGQDPALAVYMKAPASYTGDDVVELHCHGGAAAADNALRALLAAGCRMAEPGEFTFRAFINGKMDLAQAEAVSDIITSGSSAAFDLAQKQLAGALSERLNDLYDRVNALRSECEARLDFPDEELDFSSDEELALACIDIEKEVRELLSTRDRGSQLRDGVEVVLAGRPNAGKSSLLNRLLGFERAIVSSIPGTTRDTVEARTVLNNIPVILTDTAGLRESTDPIEQQGIERSRRSIAAGEVTFWLLDASSPDREAELADLAAAQARNIIAVWNKGDLVPGFVPPALKMPQVVLSAVTGEGIPELIEKFSTVLNGESDGKKLPDVAVNVRIAGELEEALLSLETARTRFLDADHELAAADLAAAGQALGETVGKTASPDLLDSVFHRFCIGK
ncbi:MAG: tRNA uridine-5-carboxymethylaminomethyl(34) synthesis GTPase MnmE [Lentisphaeria bacterium]|nr:tRNA uridine-5-carboxymethylaminomethyl(34) synthesis GTPase MnmE [Lentisphaeria bacterium]